MEEKTTSKKTPAKRAPAKETVASQPTPSKPVARKTASTGAEKTAPVKAAGPAAAEPVSPPTPDLPAEAAAESLIQHKPSPEERYRMVEAAAYFIAEKDGFRDCSTHYWTQAEQEIAEQLGETGS